MPYYGVRIGRSRGVFDNWPDCYESVNGYPKNEYRKFNTSAEAKAYVDGQTLDMNIHHNADSSPIIANNHFVIVQECDQCDSDSSDDSLYYVDWLGEVYVDGCCLGNGGPDARAGVGVYWGANNPLNISRRLRGKQTNQCAEIEAARIAVVQAKQQGYDTLHLYTDSKFFQQCMEEYIIKWEENGWTNAKGFPVVHKKEFQNLQAEMEDIEVEIIHILAHKGNPGNEEADRLAKLGAKKPYPKEPYDDEDGQVTINSGPRYRCKRVPKGTKPWEVDLFA